MGATDFEHGVTEDSIETHIPSAAISDEKREAHEVFKVTEDGVAFRTVTWQRATIIFLKIQFAMSILSVPASLATLGAVGGGLSLFGWDVLNTCKADHRQGSNATLTDVWHGQIPPLYWATSGTDTPSATH